MKPKYQASSFAKTFFVALSLAMPSAHAASLYWDGGVADKVQDGVSEGGAGTWNATLVNWTDALDTPETAWIGSSDAIFGTTGGTVAVGSATGTAGIAIAAGDIDFATTGYILNLGTHTSLNKLTATSLSGSAATITSGGTNANGQFILANPSAVTWSGTITTGNFTKTGAGTLNFTGTIIVQGTYAAMSFQGGTTHISAGTTLGGAGFYTSNSGTVVNLGNTNAGDRVVSVGYGTEVTTNGTARLRHTSQYDALNAFGLLSGTLGVEFAHTNSAGTSSNLYGANTYTGGTYFTSNAAATDTLNIHHDNSMGTGKVAMLSNKAGQTSIINFMSPTPTIGSLESSGVGVKSIVLGNAAPSLLGKWTAGTNVITLSAATTALAVGQTIPGSAANGIPATAFITEITGGTTFTISENATITKTANTAFTVAPVDTTLTVGALNTVASFAGNISQAADTLGSVTKTGTGRWTLSGNNTYTGLTQVNQGTLIATSGTSLSASSLGLSVANAATFAYRPTAAGSLNLGTGVLTLVDGSAIGTAVGGSASQSVLASSAAAIASGAVTVDIWAIPGVPPEDGAHNLLTVASGLTSGTATYSLGKVYNASDFTVSGLTASDTAISVTTASATALTSAFWKGGLAGYNNVWAVSNGSTTSNWASDDTGTATPLVPGSTTDVTFSSTGAVSQTSTILGLNMTINSLSLSDTSAVALNADGYTLTIAGAAALTVNSGAGASTFNVPIALTNPTPTISIGETSLTTVSGAISGAASSLTKSGTGTLVLAATNTYTGTTKVNEGVLRLDAGKALPGGIGATGGTSNLTLNGGILGLTATSGDFTRGPGTAANQVQWAYGTGGFAAYGGNRSVNFGGAGATMTWSTNAGGIFGSELILSAADSDSTITVVNPINLNNATRTVTVNNGSAAVDAVLSGILSHDSGMLTKGGAGTLALTGANTYDGITTVTAGTLLINGNQGDATGAVIVASGTTLGGTGIIGGILTVESGGTIAPGASIGTFTTLTDAVIAGNYACEVNGNAADALVVGGNLDLTGATLAIQAVGSGITKSSYVIATYTGTRTGEFTISPALPSGCLVSYDDTLKQVKLIGTAAPYPYDSFVSVIANPADREPGDDPDADGISNLVEFVLHNGNPVVSAQGILPIVTVDADNIILTFKRSDDAESTTSQSVEISENLSDWTTIPSIPIGPASSLPAVNIAQQGGYDDVTVTIPRNGAIKKFVRLRAVLTSP